jgi:hypothetical protein
VFLIDVSDVDSSLGAVFVWLFVVIPAVAFLLGVAAGLVARRHRWSHPMLLGLAAFVATLATGWMGAAAYDALN